MTVLQYPARGLYISARLAACVLGPILCAGAAHAQVASTIVDPFVPVDFDRGRNVGVAEQGDPNFQALGVRFGTFTAYPSIAVSSGVTNNVYLNNIDKVSDAVFTLQPGIRLRSGWSQNSIDIAASANVVRYAHETLRNRQEYSVTAIGLLDISSNIQARARIQYDRLAESPYANDLAANVSVLSQYARLVPNLAFIYTRGHTRLTASAEQYTFRFNTIRFADGTSRDQSERDKTINRLAIQGDYAFTPSLAVYAQANADQTNYKTLRSSGAANRDGDAVRFITGVSLDLAGLLRGRVGVGYVRRTYDSDLYKTAQGLSLESDLAFFVTPLTTVTLAGQSSIQDANIGNSGAYRDNRLSLTADHSLLRNLLITAKALWSQRKILENASSNQTVTQFTLNAKYQTNRFTSIGLGLGYGKGRSTGTSAGVPFDELQGQVTLQVRL
ncbi:outer membrane beta-barrel protein [Novosphingobium sp. Rr 2-17]|uniref:outer membrane beta-barrel protein n=1 Tax=Novosphingobium sp. Rr 2-17 TaxID=555793 RepID=UPI0012F6BCDD|nr:outer membrane beta-barrel protein [Novosphingobium sp. Rr 2-17]